MQENGIVKVEFKNLNPLAYLLNLSTEKKDEIHCNSTMNLI